MGDFTSRKFEIEFYNSEGQPLLSRKGNVNGLPVNEKLVESVNSHSFDYTSKEAIEMFEEQDKIIFNEIKKICELTYYNDIYEINTKRSFSYQILLNAGKTENIGKSFLISCNDS